MLSFGVTRLLMSTCAFYSLYKKYLCASVSVDHWGNLALTDDAPVTRSYQYVIFTQPYDTLQFTTIFGHWLKKIVFEQIFRVWTESILFVNWHCVDILGINTSHQ